MNINNDIGNEFADYLATAWAGSFQHSFPLSIKPRHPAWTDWRKMLLPGSDSKWYCGNLREAFKRYSWTSLKDGPHIEEIRQQLRYSIAAGSKEDARFACRLIFKWGGVARQSSDPSQQWINEAERDLPQQIRNAVILLGDLESDLTEFDGKRLLMNSAMTKVYWAADPENKLAIYDGRVGAALGLLAREFLKSKEYQAVPEKLQFRWGSSHDKHVRGQHDKRDPSCDLLKFPRLFSATKKDFHHAKMMRDASFLLQNVAAKIGNVTVHDLEKALFMVGYNVFGSIKS